MGIIACYTRELSSLTEDLKVRVNSCTKENAPHILAQVERLYRDHLLPSSHTHLPLDDTHVQQLTEGNSIVLCNHYNPHIVFRVAILYNTL